MTSQVLYSLCSIILTSSLLLLLACEVPTQNPSNFAPYKKIEDKEAASLLQKAIQAAGSLDTWNNLTMIAFEKHFVLFSENGELEQDINQSYIQLNGKSYDDLSGESDSSTYLSYQLGSDFLRIGGEINPNLEGDALRNSILSASFVISLPFKLLDKGAVLTYAGKDSLNQGQEVEVLKVDYNPEAHGNHSTEDIWWHYFDSKTYKHLAYMVKHADHYSYVENLSLVEAGGITFPETRKSWRVDENRNLLWLRADYEYSAYRVE